MPHNPLDTLKRRVKELERMKGKPLMAAWCDTDEEYQKLMNTYGVTHRLVIITWEGTESCYTK